MIDTESLSKEEVERLINEVKYFSENITLSIPLIGKYKLDKEVVGKESELSYRFHVYRGLNAPLKYSLHLRFSDNNLHLIRICINGSNHKNYDGTKVGKNHVHIYDYVEAENKVFDYAYELKNFPFDENDQLSDAVNKFTEYISLKIRGE